jgi:hypothetical protein
MFHSAPSQLPLPPHNRDHQWQRVQFGVEGDCPSGESAHQKSTVECNTGGTRLIMNNIAIRDGWRRRDPVSEDIPNETSLVGFGGIYTVNKFQI